MSTSPVSLNFTPFSATPNFAFTPGYPRTVKMVLTADVTSSTVDTSNLAPDTRLLFVIQQDAVGGHRFTWPLICKGAQPIAQQPNAITVQGFVWDGINLLAHGLPAIY